jgi:NhaP-type Na+/H+ or K+/H+ antiporter
MAVTWIVTFLGAWLLTDLPPEIALLFGALTVVTGPTVIVPMLKTVRPVASVSAILRWEGIVIDPIGASLAVLVYEFIVAGGGSEALPHTLLTFGGILAAGGAAGAAGGFFLGLFLKKRWIPDYLQSLVTLSLVLASFALSNTLQPESGLVAVTVMGIWLANTENVDMTEILDFKESLSLLLISMLFLLLAARIDLEDITALGWSGVGVFLVIQFLARPLNVMVSTAGSDLSWPERHLLAWIAPRGIIAAAISAFFALQLETAGFEHARSIVPLVFSVIIGTVVLQSVTARPIAVWLGVAEPEPRGFLVIGANIVARSVAQALVDRGFRVLLADTSSDRIAEARMKGLPTYLGNPISEHADRHLNLVGVGRLLALSHNESVNTAAMIRYRLEFGRENLFMIRAKAPGRIPDRMRLPAGGSGELLFGPQATYADLAARLSAGGGIRTTQISGKFSLSQLLMVHQGKTITLLFAVDDRERLHFFTDRRSPIPGPGWRVSYLLSETPD